MSIISRFSDMGDHAVVGGNERDALAQTLLDVGPEAPTLCTGWTAQDICIHLVIFERRPDAWFGHLTGDRHDAARRYYDGMIQVERQRPWPELVQRLRSGPRFGPLALDAIRDRMFLREYTIHHEDVRRANGMTPRTGIDGIQEAAWSKLPGFARIIAPKDLGVQAVWPGHGSQQLREGDTTVTITGEPLEILLHVFGRPQVAQVELAGSDADLERFGPGELVSRPALPRMRTTSG